MNNGLKKLLALVVAVLLLSGLSITAAAASASIEDVVGQSPVEKKAIDRPIGIFALRLSHGEDMTHTTAFLIKNGSRHYLLTNSIVKTYADKGYELTLMGTDGVNTPAVVVGTDKDYEMAYLKADGMGKYEPLTFSPDSFKDQVVLGLSCVNSSFSLTKYVEYRSYSLSGFEQVNDSYYIDKDKEVDLQWMGCPVLTDKTSVECQGIATYFQQGKSKRVLGIIHFEDLKMDRSYALGTGSMHS